MALVKEGYVGYESLCNDLKYLSVEDIRYIKAREAYQLGSLLEKEVL